jgi:hypothetical protein
MGDAEAERLARALSMTTRLHPKLFNSPAAPGALRPSPDSGLILVPGSEEGTWPLESRTWGDPALALVAVPSATE